MMSQFGHIKVPIDFQAGVENCGGDEDMFKSMLENVRQLTLDPCTKPLVESVIEMDFTKIDYYTDSIKGSLSYLAANKCVFLVCELEKFARAGDDKNTTRKLLQLIDALRALYVFLDTFTGKTSNHDLDEYTEKITKRKGKHTLNLFNQINVDTTTDKVPTCVVDSCNIY